MLECALCGTTVRGAVEINRHKQKHRLDLKKHQDSKKRPREEGEEEDDDADVVKPPLASALRKEFAIPRKLK